MHERYEHQRRHGDECGCEERRAHRYHEHGPMHGHGGERECGCGDRRFHRRFATRQERIARLQEYLAELRAEAQAVEERIAELQAAEVKPAE